MTSANYLGSWPQIMHEATATLEASVGVVLGAFVDHYDVPALCEAYQEAVQDAIPAIVYMRRDEFYATTVDCDYDELSAATRRAIEEIDFWSLAEQYEVT